MSSGNLSWLNLLTIILAIPAIDDRVLRLIVPVQTPALQEPGLVQKAALGLVAALVIWLSIDPIRNMLSPRQVMNTSFNPIHLVGTYGAFGSITRTRYEVVVEGTADPLGGPSAIWREYEFRGKPGDPKRLPRQVAPYHFRLDWLMWFAAMGSYAENPWFVHFVEKLLEGDRATLSLLRSNPFPDNPPALVRAQLYEYRFSTPGERKRTGQWWSRQLVGPYFPAVSLQTPSFRSALESMGWLTVAK